MSTKFYIKDKNGAYLSTDGKVRYKLLQGRKLYDFLQTRDGQSRHYHILSEPNGDKIGIETDTEQHPKYGEQHERDRYIQKVQAELQITMISANVPVYISSEEDIDLLDTLVDEDADVEDTVLHNMDLETLRDALRSLTSEEYKLIYHLYLAKTPMTERELSKATGIPQTTISYRRKSILKKLRAHF